MARDNPNALLFDEEDVKAATTAFLPRLIRAIFYGLQITNDGYLARYQEFFKSRYPNRTKKELAQKSAADRKFIRQVDKLTFNLMNHVINAMGWEIQGISVRIVDRVTGEVKTFSTDDTIEDLNRQIEAEKDKVIGMESF